MTVQSFRNGKVFERVKSFQFRAPVLKSELFRQCRTRVLIDYITAVCKDRE